MKHFRTLIQCVLSLLLLTADCEGIGCYIGYGRKALPYLCHEGAYYALGTPVCATTSPIGGEHYSYFCFLVRRDFDLSMIGGCYTYNFGLNGHILCLCTTDYCNKRKK
uniref:Uncharacterized protein n=1 Tax=Lepeophtheirus salmonis TaxID=72036 RepID=A0A0K2TQS1_LEPSM